MNNSLPTVKGLIFDLDGTLLNSLGDLHAACNYALGLHGLPARSLEEVRPLVGEGVRRMLRQASKYAGSENKEPNDADPARAIDACSAEDEKKKLDLMVRQMLDFYAANCCVKTVPYSGVQAMLETLNAQGVPVAVLSNKMHDLTLSTVAHYLPQQAFAAIEGSREGGPLKPDPSTALAIAELLGLAPSEMGFVGDTVTDMGTAVNSGMLPIGVTWGFRPAEELLASGAKVLLDKPEDLFFKIRFAV
ncbi:MAG: HAD family hydrolase [Deltaproteobacteria bacterium]|jgi:phosphoglycolate phosphatase|nr:HAD family hydrolase [Deltaproteobacteria bacterium]